MSKQATFDEVFDAVDAWPSEQQAELLDVIKHRLAEQGRKQIVQDIQDSRTEFTRIKPTSSTVEDIMREIES